MVVVGSGEDLQQLLEALVDPAEVRDAVESQGIFHLRPCRVYSAFVRHGQGGGDAERRHYNVAAAAPGCYLLVEVDCNNT